MEQYKNYLKISIVKQMLFYNNHNINSYNFAFLNGETD